MNRALGKILPRRKHLPTEMVPNVYAFDTDSKLVISVGTPPDLLSPREAVRNFYPHAPKLPKLFGRHLTCENSALNSR